MPDFVTSIVFILLGALIGAVMSYVASYRLQLRRWRADAALLRKEQIYGPVFDELAIEESLLTNYRDWVRSSSIHRFNAWDKHRNTSLGLLVPNRLSELFEAFSDSCRSYDKAGLVLNRRLQTAFPEKHNDVDDWVVAMRLADKMLVAPDERNRLVLDYLKEQRPAIGDIDSYWTDLRLQDLAATVADFREFLDLANLHQKYSSEVHHVKDEVQSRIERIVKSYQTPSKGQ